MSVDGGEGKRVGMPRTSQFYRFFVERMNHGFTGDLPADMAQADLDYGDVRVVANDWTITLWLDHLARGMDGARMSFMAGVLIGVLWERERSQQ